jgi:hypothetical protein
MKNNPLYALPIKYMVFFCLAILFSGLWLFLLSQGFTNIENLIKTIQYSIQTPKDKSLHNLIEIATPHIFAMGILIFMVSHFLIFSPKIKIRYAIIISKWLYYFMFLNIFSYFFITLGWVTLGWIKILALSGFFLFFLILLTMVWVSL